MKVYKGLNAVGRSLKGSVVTIGVFDGLHIGHRKVIGAALRRAKALGVPCAVVTFDPHPARVLNAGARVPSLISLAHRIRLVGELGVGRIVVLNFTPTLARLSPEAFVRDVLADRIGAAEAFVGDNFYFGRGGAAGTKELQALAGAYGLKVTVIRRAMVAGHIVSSSLIRRSIRQGCLAKAAKLLGRPIAVLGTVVKGANVARELGYPTANLNPHHEVIPPSGVYAVRVRIGRRLLKGILNIGVRPTFYGPRDREPSIEVHIFGFHEQIYGKDIEVLFMKKLRNEVKFSSRNALIRQIMKDARAARVLLR